MTNPPSVVIPGREAVTPVSYFVTRQPILTVDEQVFGYELFFRDGADNLFGGFDVEVASRSALSTSLLQGIDVLCDGRSLS